MKAVLFCMVVGVWPVVLHAHDRPPQVSLLLQPDQQGVAALWRIHVMGEEAARMRAMADTDHNGVLVGHEVAWVAAALARKAVMGVHVSWNGRVLKASHTEEPLFYDEGEGGMRAGVLVSYVLPTPEGVLECGVSVKRPSFATGIHTLGLWSLVSCFKGGSQRCEQTLTQGQLLLGYGEGVRVVLRKG